MKDKLNKQVHLNRIEFFITYNCTSHCDHCSVYSGETKKTTGIVDLETAAKLIKDVCKNYKIDSVMTFGGEPLLYPDLVCKIHETAKNYNIPDRQIITNCCWSKDKTRINEIVEKMADAQINDILISIDCFHEKCLDYEIVKYTVEQLKKQTKANLFLQPVWVRSKDDSNPYNEKTKEVLAEFNYLEIPANEGNILFPAGRALINLSEYFPKPSVHIHGTCKDLPYTDMPNDITSICVNPNGDIIACNVIGNIHDNNITDILKFYDYKNDKVLKTMVEKGSEGLYELAEQNNIVLSAKGYYSVCELCKDVSRKLQKSVE